MHWPCISHCVQILLDWYVIAAGLAQVEGEVLLRLGDLLHQRHEVLEVADLGVRICTRSGSTRTQTYDVGSIGLIASLEYVVEDGE